MSHPVFGNTNIESIKLVSLHKKIKTLSTFQNQVDKPALDVRLYEGLTENMLFDQVRIF